MGNLKPIDSALVKDVDYDLISPDTVGGEYIETIGAACENPDGYTSGSLFLGKENGVQHLYRATAAIAFGETIILDTNCTYTTVSSELEGKAEKSEVTLLNEALTNKTNNIVDVMSTNGSKNILPNDFADVVSYGLTFHRDTETGTISVSGTKSDSSVHQENIFLGFTLPKGQYYISDGDVENNLGIRITESSGGTLIVDTRNSHSTTFTLNADTVCDARVVYDGTTNKVYNSVVKPMICLNSWPNKTYTPYAMTNRELTESIDEIGKIKSQYAQSVSVPANTGTKVGSITLSKGAWVIRGSVNTMNGTGTFSAQFDNDTMSPPREKCVTGQLISDRQSFLEIINFVKVASDTQTIDLYCYYKGTGNLTVYPTMSAIRIK